MLLPVLLLSLPLAVIEVTAYGAVPDDATSDSAAFRAAFAAATSGDTVHAGCGVWDLPRIDNLSAVYLTGKTNVTFDGDGTCTSLKMAGGTHVGDYHLFNLYANTNLTFKDFACDGNRINIVSADEQTHCINDHTHARVSVMRLIDLNPNWVSYGGEGVSNADGSPIPRREQIGVMFDCPCGCASPCFISFKNPSDGGPQYDTRTGWQRDGDTFETLTLSPSILRSKEKGGCGWHGWIQNGEVKTC